MLEPHVFFVIPVIMMSSLSDRERRISMRERKKGEYDMNDLSESVIFPRGEKIPDRVHAENRD
jgi:hypothetical protein